MHRRQQRHRRLPSRSKGANSSKFDTSLAARSLLLIVRQGARMRGARRLGGLGLVGLDGLPAQDLTEQDATDEGVALLAFEPKLVRPGAIGERLVVEEVLRLL